MAKWHTAAVSEAAPERGEGSTPSKAIGIPVSNCGRLERPANRRVRAGVRSFG